MPGGQQATAHEPTSFNPQIDLRISLINCMFVDRLLNSASLKNTVMENINALIYKMHI